MKVVTETSPSVPCTRTLSITAYCAIVAATGLAALALTAPVVAQDAAKPDEAAAAPKPDLVCRSFKPTGSRVPKKVCATAATWAEVDARGKEGARQFMQQMGDQGAQARPPTGVANPL